MNIFAAARALLHRVRGCRRCHQVIAWAEDEEGAALFQAWGFGAGESIRL